MNRPGNWPGQDLETAEAGYRRALDQADEIRSALAVRDRAFAALPEYSQWLVHRHPDGPGDDLAGLVEDALGQGPPAFRDAEPRADEPAAITQVAQELDNGLGKLVQRFVRDAEAIAKDRLREDWEAESAAAAVTFPDDEKLTRRTAIWDRLDHIRLHDVEVARSPLSTRQDRRDVRSRSARSNPPAALRSQGTLAMAALGGTWFSHPDFKDHDQGDYSKTLERLRHCRTGPRMPIPGGRKRRGRGTGLACDSALREPRSTRWPTRDAGSPTHSRRSNRGSSAADGLARLVDRGEDPPAASAVEPSSRYRQARVHDLLVWMADRAWLDHWYSEDPAAPPYYQAIVARLFNDAQGLFPELSEADLKVPRAHSTLPADWPSNGPEPPGRDQRARNLLPGTVSLTRPVRRWLPSRPAFPSSGRGSADR